MSLLLEAVDGGKIILCSRSQLNTNSLLYYLFPYLISFKFSFSRLHLDDGGGAWCPARPVGSAAAAAAAAAAAVVSQPAAEPQDPAAADPPPPQQPPPLSPPPSEEEYIQIDLGNLTVVTAVLTQGR